MAKIEENVKSIIGFLEEYRLKTGREVYLVGATKTKSVGEINRAVAAGLKIVGENRAQEFRDKYDFILPQAEKHFIGHLQENKIKYVVGKAALIHSCDSLRLATAVSDYAGKSGAVQNMLIEVNVSGESNKHGFAANEITEVSKILKTLNNVRFTGVMTVLPNAEERVVRLCAEKTAEIYNMLKSTVFGGEFEFLSMGMSGDYKIALEAGANMLRLGRAIFGERE